VFIRDSLRYRAPKINLTADLPAAASGRNPISWTTAKSPDRPETPNVVYFLKNLVFRSEGPAVNRPCRKAGIGLFLYSAPKVRHSGFCAGPSGLICPTDPNPELTLWAINFRPFGPQPQKVNGIRRDTPAVSGFSHVGPIAENVFA
jgi:hypothetical protein